MRTHHHSRPALPGLTTSAICRDWLCRSVAITTCDHRPQCPWRNMNGHLACIKLAVVAMRVNPATEAHVSKFYPHLVLCLLPEPSHRDATATHAVAYEGPCSPSDGHSSTCYRDNAIALADAPCPRRVCAVCSTTSPQPRGDQQKSMACLRLAV